MNGVELFARPGNLTERIALELVESFVHDVTENSEFGVVECFRKFLRETDGECHKRVDLDIEGELPYEIPVRSPAIESAGFKIRPTLGVRAKAFYQHRDRVRAAARYAHFELPDQPALALIRKTFEKARHSLERLEYLIANEARLLSEFLEPVEEAIQSYSVRYLQVFDTVTALA